MGMHLIPCKDCNCRYYGETERKLNVRLEEHCRDCRLGAQTSNGCEAYFGIRSEIDWGNGGKGGGGAGTILKENDVGKCRIVEGALIHLFENFKNNKP